MNRLRRNIYSKSTLSSIIVEYSVVFYLKLFADKKNNSRKFLFDSQHILVKYIFISDEVKMNEVEEWT